MRESSSRERQQREKKIRKNPQALARFVSKRCCCAAIASPTATVWYDYVQCAARRFFLEGIPRRSAPCKYKAVKQPKNIGGD
jgi:hypothetical protein